jgi:hypothetical protein
VPRVEWDTRRAVILLVAVVAIAYADILFLGRGLFLADITSYHYPMKHAVRDAVFRGEFPFWNRFFSGGQPLAANPAYELWYPPQWLIFLPSFHQGMQLHIVIHFALAAIGMLLLLRSLGAGVWASLFGAVSFAFSGPYLSLSMKLPILFSLSWMPLALYFARRFLVERRGGDFAGAVLSLGMQLLLGEPTMAMQTWGLIAAYLIWRRDRRDLLPIASVALAAMLVAAIQLIPAIDHARDSVRSQSFTFQVASNWSMPLQRVAEWVMPSVFRHIAPDISTMYPFRTEPFLGEIYVGLLVAILAVAGIFTGSRGWWGVLALVVISVIVAAGEHTPLFRLLYDAHLVRAIRYPEKFIVTAAFVLIVWAALILDRILAGDRKLAKTALTLAIAWACMAALLALAGSDRAYFGLGALRAVAAAVLLSMPRRRTWILVAAVGLDLWWVTHNLVPRMPRAYFDPPPLARELGPPSHDGRVYHRGNWDWWDQNPNAVSWVSNRSTPQFWWLFRNGLLPNLPALYGHELALEEDIDLTALRNTTELRDALVEARRMGNDEPYAKMSNVHWRLRFRPAQSDVDLNTQPVEIVRTNYPRYFFADAIERAETAMDVRARIGRNAGPQNVAFVNLEPFVPAPGMVTKGEEWNNGARLGVRIDSRASGRALLVMSVTGHKYWSATLDGRPAALLPADIAYQAMVVPVGDHVIEMRYRNPLVAVGAIVSFLTLAALLAIRRRPRWFDRSADRDYRRPIAV